jgi:3-methyl-2-oxobutanoate hydroxymethyltransferase
LGVQQYTNAVRNGTFPSEDGESYTMDKLEWARFLEQENELKA